MANTKELDDAIERMREDKDCPEGLLEMLVELREGISETASEAEVEEIVRKPGLEMIYIFLNWGLPSVDAV